MRNPRVRIAAACALIVASTLLGGCAALVEDQMNRQNESDLKNGRQTPAEYQDRQSAIDRAFSGRSSSKKTKAKPKPFYQN